MISRMIWKDTLKSLAPELSAGIVSLILLSCTLFTIGAGLGWSEDVFSLGTSVFTHGHVHLLLLYPLHQRSVLQLLLGAAVMVTLCGGAEKSLGTVRFLFLFPLLSITTGLLYVSVATLLDASLQRPAEGFMPAALACVAVTTVRSRMAKAYLLGVNVPVLALPWLLLLFLTLVVPNAVFLCNALAILTGWTYGRGWLPLLAMSEARASVLDRKLPFRLLRRCGVLYIPAALEERRKTLHPPITPAPGSYPVQAYAPLSSPSNLQATETTPSMYEGWPHASYTPAGHQTPSGPYGHQHQHGHSHSQAQSSGLHHGHSHGQSCNHSHGQGHGQGHHGQGHHGGHVWGNNILSSHSQQDCRDIV